MCNKGTASTSFQSNVRVVFFVLMEVRMRGAARLRSFNIFSGRREETKRKKSLTTVSIDFVALFVREKSRVCLFDALKTSQTYSIVLWSMHWLICYFSFRWEVLASTYTKLLHGIRLNRFITAESHCRLINASVF